MFRRQWFPVVSAPRMKFPQRRPEAVQHTGALGGLGQQGREGSSVQRIICGGRRFEVIVVDARRRSHHQALPRVSSRRLTHHLATIRGRPFSIRMCQPTAKVPCASTGSSRKLRRRAQGAPPTHQDHGQSPSLIGHRASLTTCRASIYPDQDGHQVGGRRDPFSPVSFSQVATVTRHRRGILLG
jgi:hypothetical protein